MFNNQVFQRRFVLLNNDEKWHRRDYLDFAIRNLNDIDCWESDYGVDTHWTTKIDAKWEKLRSAFFGDVTPKEWN